MGVSKSIVDETNVPLNIALKQITQLVKQMYKDTGATVEANIDFGEHYMLDITDNHKLAIQGGSEVLIVNGKEALQSKLLKFNFFFTLTAKT
ncbi:unnamed protein product [Rhizophagus irregularis]|nr:unnamed protein product [Rhizophagus irregularis]CAB5382543.1 unnamed protein product [Rhizophagus irregularis]